MAKKKELAMNLASLDDLFSAQEQREEDSREKILEISLSEISEFPNHPFHVKMDSEMEKLVVRNDFRSPKKVCKRPRGKRNNPLYRAKFDR